MLTVGMSLLCATYKWHARYVSPILCQMFADSITIMLEEKHSAVNDVFDTLLTW